MKPEGCSAPWYELHSKHCSHLLQGRGMYKTGEDIWNSYSALPSKLCGVWSSTAMSEEKLTPWQTHKDLSWEMQEMTPNNGRVGRMCSFNLQYEFPPSLTVRAPRCEANETPLSGYSSWKAKHDNMKFYCVCVCVCTRVREKVTRGHRKPLQEGLSGRFSPRSDRFLIKTTRWKS